jgi:multimeric flavodoxin WrbA
MVKIAVVCHSGYGHTQVVADQIAEGAASHPEVDVIQIDAASITSPESENLAVLDSCDAMIFGSPTYMGSASAAFKGFMEASSSRWMEQRWANKIAAGFTNSGSMSGDKESTLHQMVTFAMQHSMVWVGLGQMPGNNHSGGSANDLNRIGASLGMMAQSNVDEGPDTAPIASDRETARVFGKRVADTVIRWG